MDSENEPYINEDQLIPKLEPIDVDFIKNEKNEEEEECFVVTGIVEKNLVKEELLINEENETCSSLNVRNLFLHSTIISFIIVFFKMVKLILKFVNKELQYNFINFQSLNYYNFFTFLVAFLH